MPVASEAALALLALTQPARHGAWLQKACKFAVADATKAALSKLVLRVVNGGTSCPRGAAVVMYARPDRVLDPESGLAAAAAAFPDAGAGCGADVGDACTSGADADDAGEFWMPGGLTHNFVHPPTGETTNGDAGGGASHGVDAHGAEDYDGAGEGGGGELDQYLDALCGDDSMGWW